jgi:hypothetical protein
MDRRDARLTGQLSADIAPSIGNLTSEGLNAAIGKSNFLHRRRQPRTGQQTGDRMSLRQIGSIGMPEPAQRLHQRRSLSPFRLSREPAGIRGSGQHHSCSPVSLSLMLITAQINCGAYY